MIGLNNNIRRKIKGFKKKLLYIAIVEWKSKMRISEDQKSQKIPIISKGITKKTKNG